jgi:hypothetical protein
MNRTFPPELQQFLKIPMAKRSWVSAGESEHPSDCQNCAGWGYIIGTIAIVGPLDSPGAMGVVSHYADGKWWIVNSKSFKCPVCLGVKPSKPYVERMQVPGMLKRAAKEHEKS